MRLECGTQPIEVTPLLMADGREWTLPDRTATVTAPLSDRRSVRASWSGGLRVVLDAEPLRNGWRLSVRVEALRAVTLDRVGVRVRTGGFSRVLVDGYHSWDWAGTRDGTGGSGWWTALAGHPEDPRRLRLALAGQPAAGALAISWTGGTDLDALVCGEPLQAGERSGAPRSLELRLRTREVFAADRIDITDGEPPAAEPGRARVPLPVRRRRVGWMSWNCLGAAVTAADVLDARQLVPRGGVILMDDGWMDHWGDWRESARLGDTVPGLAAELNRSGHDLGLWIAPFLVDRESEVAAEHPEWLLRDAAGIRVVDHRPPRPQWVLDASRDDVGEHLRTQGMRLAAAGTRVVKADFLYAGGLPGLRPPGWSGIRAISRGLAQLATGFRHAAGADGQLWACGAPGPAVAGVADCCRSGGDAVLRVPALGVTPLDPPTFVHGPLVLRAQARNLAARSWLWGSAMPCDIDAVTAGQVGDTPPVDDAAFEDWLRMARRSGGPLLDSDVPGRLDAGRLARLSTEMARPHRGGAERPADPLELLPAPRGDDDFLSWAPGLPEAWARV